MSDASQVTCPECQTTQSATAPFCENCGYRIRRSDTVKEGHEAITAEALKRARAKRPAPAKQSGGQAVGSAEGPAGADGSAGPTHKSGTNRGAESPEGPKTYIEGLQRVDVPKSQTGGADASQSMEVAAATSQSGLVEHPGQADTSGKLAIYMAIWLSLTAVAVFATYYFATRPSDEAAGEGPEAIPAKVEVAAGPFLRGLEGNVRSFILQMCQKVEDDPKETCKESELLKGEYPAKEVEIAAFEIDATETTVGEYQKCVDADACSPVNYKDCEVWTHQGLQISLRVPKALQEPNMPVTCVTPEQAKTYCEWADGELPSADQWEKAARGTEGKLFPWGESWSSEIANWGEMDIAKNPIVGKLDGFEWTAPPGSFPKGKSPFGAYDMGGNVAEWVQTSKKLKPVARGGSWTSHPFDLRVTARQELEAGDMRTDVGFRCVY